MPKYDGEGYTLLHRVVMRGDVLCASELIAFGEDVNAKDIYGFAPIHYAARYEYTGIISILGNVHIAGKDSLTALHIACIEGRVNAVETLGGLGADVNCRDIQGRTPLHYAAKYGHCEIVSILASNYNADVNTHDLFRHTPLSDTKDIDTKLVLTELLYKKLVSSLINRKQHGRL
jgi:ankyrin repeat protein